MNQNKSGRNYKRNTLLALASQEQILLLEGVWTHYNETNVVISHIKAWAPRADDPIQSYPNNEEITNHVNLLRSEVGKWLDVKTMQANISVILIARPYIYGYDGERRGGIQLVSLRGIPGIFRKKQKELREKLGQIPRDAYIDWLTYQDSRYAWAGRRKWKDGHLPSKREAEAERKKRAVKERIRLGLPVTKKDRRLQQKHDKRMDKLARNANRC